MSDDRFFLLTPDEMRTGHQSGTHSTLDSLRS